MLTTNPRAEYLTNLASAVASGRFPEANEWLFRLIYGAPPPLVVHTAVIGLARYRPTSVRIRADELLAAPQAWVAAHGRAVPDDPPDLGPGDAAFLGALDGLLIAVAYPAYPRLFTPGACVALTDAIHAQMDQIWEIVDPEAVELWRKSGDENAEAQACGVADALLRRMAHPARLAAQSEGWERLLGDFRAAGFSALPDTLDPAQREADLAVWREQEYLLLSPVARPPFEGL